MQQVTKEEKSAGGVVYRKLHGQYEFLIGKHSGYHKWVLPKGMQEAHEELQETAEREVWEEVGAKVKIVDLRPIKTIAYYYFADIGEVKEKNPHTGETLRRVIKYQEDGGGKVRVHKEVTYYLMELVEDSGESGWEMEERKWVSYKEAMQLLAFETEREVLAAAGIILECL